MIYIEPMYISPDEIAFDIDGVFADTFRVFVHKAGEDYGYHFSYEDITEYDFMNVLHMDEQISEEIIQTLLDYPLESGIRPLDGAVDVLTHLSSVGPLLFVTARPNKAPILRWILHQLPEVDKNSIHLEATNTHKEKLPILLENNVNYFVEDRLETCYFLEKASITPIVFKQPWNRKPHPFPVVESWDEIRAMIEW